MKTEIEVLEKNSKIIVEKLKTMDAKGVILAMIHGLEKQHVGVRMGTFGTRKGLTNICYGCAATNALCEMGLDSDMAVDLNYYMEKVTAENVETLQYFEFAINSLRMGEIPGYNWYVKKAKLQNLIMPEESRYLPKLHDSNYIKDLIHYKILAESL